MKSDSRRERLQTASNKLQTTKNYYGHCSYTQHKQATKNKLRGDGPLAVQCSPSSVQLVAPGLGPAHKNKEVHFYGDGHKPVSVGWLLAKLDLGTRNQDSGPGTRDPGCSTCAELSEHFAAAVHSAPCTTHHGPPVANGDSN